MAEALAQALNADERLAATTAELGAENTRLREAHAAQQAELERVAAELAVLQRMLFGRSSERARPGGGERTSRPEGAGGGRQPGRRGPGARAGRRDYSHLPRIEVIWDFPGGGYRCPDCGMLFTLLGDDVSEQVDWAVVVRVVVHCRRRYRRACRCPVPATVAAPGPPKAIGKGPRSQRR